MINGERLIADIITAFSLGETKNRDQKYASFRKSCDIFASGVEASQPIARAGHHTGRDGRSSEEALLRKAGP